MVDELVIIGDVRAWSEQVVPDDGPAADRAAVMAIRAYAAGASVGEACRMGREYLASRARHPSRRPGPAVGRLALVS